MSALAYKSRVFMQIVDFGLKSSTVHIILLQDILQLPLESQLLLRCVTLRLVDLVQQLRKGTTYLPSHIRSS